MSTLVAEPQAPVSTRRPWVLLVASVAIVALIVVGNRLWTDYQNRSPYGPKAVGARLSLTVVSPSQAGKLLDAMVGPGKETPLYPSGNDDSLRSNVVGRLTLPGPNPARGEGFYAFFLIDKAAGQSVPFLYGNLHGTDLGPGWDSRYDAIAARYPSLQALGPHPAALGFFDQGMSISFTAGAPGTVVIHGALAQALPAGVAPVDSVTAVLAFFNDDLHLHWATTVPMTQLR
jgi:hypothetical protein